MTPITQPTDALREQHARGIATLAEWAASSTFDSIEKPVLARAVRVLFDDLAAMIGARDEPQVKEVHGRTLARAKVAEATVFRGGRARTDQLSAVVANGIAADWLELDEGYRPTPCHAGLYVVPALIAECEARDVKVRDMLRALVLAYEIVTRVARSFSPAKVVMQSHGRYCAVGAAAGVALARGANADLLHAAITGAVTLITAAPRDHLVSGALIRNVWPAVGGWAGTMSVEWAECGIRGVDNAFHDVYATVHGGTTHPERLTEQLGERWSILDGYLKLYACCQHLHSSIEAVLGIRDSLLRDAPLEDVTEIEVETHPLALPLANPRPKTTLGAKFSLPHAVAAALATGSGGADAFMSTTLDDARIARLRERVNVKPYRPLPDPPHDRPSRVTIRQRDGRTATGECASAQGGTDRPFPPDVFIDKITALAAPVYPRFVSTYRELARLDDADLAQPWRGVVERVCGTG